jgi:hypothetical protein
MNYIVTEPHIQMRLFTTALKIGRESARLQMTTERAGRMDEITENKAKKLIGSAELKAWTDAGLIK